MGLMVHGKEDAPGVTQMFPERAPHPQFASGPGGQGRPEAGQSTRRGGQPGIQDAVEEFQEGFIVERDQPDVGDGDAGFTEAVGYSLGGKGFIMADAREALFLGGGDNDAVAEEDGGGIVVEAG